MKRFSIDRSSMFLIAILVVLALSIGGLGFALRSEAAGQTVKTDRILNLAVIIERGGKPASTQLFLFYPTNGRGALLDVPGETGLIIKSLNRVDRIDVLYGRNPRAYISEIAHLLSTDIPYYIVMDEQGLAAATDLLEGIELFVPTPIDSLGPPRVLLPSGAVILDGDKAVQFAAYRDPDEGDADAAARRQKLFQSIFRRIGEKSAWLARGDVFPSFKNSLRTNLGAESLKRLLPELAKLDADRLVLQRVTGAYKNVDGKRLLFPHYDGELVRDIVKQTLNALASSLSSSPADKIFTIEILNGTPTKGLAKRAAEIFQSFGYDVVSISNADREDYASTTVIDRFSNAEAAKNIGNVIRCSNLVSRPAGDPVEGTKADADFSIILGKDFNGRYISR
jgi:anionic cell wall polymer biosynthesis LytR-Cps2A-Psr (LCP) family protein